MTVDEASWGITVMPAMHRSFFLFITTTVLTILLSNIPTRAAKFIFSGHCDITILGVIEPVDVKAFHALARRAILDSACTREQTSVAVYSSGGDLNAALEIGREIRTLQWDTRAPHLYTDGKHEDDPADGRRVCERLPGEWERIKNEEKKNAAARDAYYSELNRSPPAAANNYRRPVLRLPGAPWSYNASNRSGNSDCICASACFFIWVAGSERSGSVLQIHRPFFSPTGEKHVDLQDTQLAYVKQIDQARRYLSDMGLPSKMIEEVFQIEPEHPKYLSKDQAIALQFPPSIKEVRRLVCANSAPEQSALDDPRPSLAYPHLTIDQRRKLIDQIDNVIARAKADICWSKYMQSQRLKINANYLLGHPE